MSKNNLEKVLKERFEKHMHRHPDVSWEEVRDALTEEVLYSLARMEESSGEPDVFRFADGLSFVDFSKESPAGRRSLSYDCDARVNRKKNPPFSDVESELEKMGAVLLTESEYRAMQALESFDEKTSSWIWTPKPIRDLGGALFCDRRYNTVFVYHNGADSYYASRGFRAKIEFPRKKD